MKTLHAFTLLIVSAVPALAGSNGPSAPEKSRYSIFHPTPAAEMREMSTDRPDQTESAFTVDAGHVQIEMDLINWTRDRSGGITTETLAIAPINFKIGLTNNIDVQFVYDSYAEERVRGGGERSHTSGWGDLTTRVKINLWGNDGGKTALALMPFVKIPVASGGMGNGEVEGGLIVPLAVSLSERAGLGLMTELDILADDEGGGHHLEWVNSATVSFDFTDKFGAYAELFTVVRGDGAPWVAQFDAGLTYGLTENLQLDCGCNFGLTRSAPDYQPFVGVSVRF